MGSLWSSLKVPENDTFRFVDTVILGAGVIGLSTAYQLALAFEAAGKTRTGNSNSRGPKIVVVEPAKHISPGASGTATGGLGDFGFGTETAALGKLSYITIQATADKFNGKTVFGYSDQAVYRVTPEGFTETPKPPNDWGPGPPTDKPLSDLPDWIEPKKNWTVQLLAGAPHGAHLDPGLYCKFLYEESKKLGVHFIFNANVTSVNAHPALKLFTSVQVQKYDGPRLTIWCRSIVIAAGPWSGRVYSSLFPQAKAKFQLNSIASAGNHFRVRTPGWKPSDDEQGSKQVFLNNVTPNRKGLDITSFLGGSLYVGGFGAIPEELPEFAEFVKAQPSEIEEMVKLVKEYLKMNADDELEIFDEGRCYRPYATPNHPIITQVDWGLLGIDTSPNARPQEQHTDVLPNSSTKSCSFTVGGLFLNTAHNSDGMTLSLGSGKVMSELLLGLPPSVDISGLGLDEAQKIRLRL
ncbi:nucleotide-binding domain-containing protein [Lojkania enalia]|uniref:Nucleotide-binding domain-containing protein n=1 Tax=Lojkania enalia TaxID=147567 RepID=A0A9P4K2P8_9PLEO|nr:nucleotide-binding domain-containing protein [Didymosphaeria enalia]